MTMAIDRVMALRLPTYVATIEIQASSNAGRWGSIRRVDWDTYPIVDDRDDHGEAATASSVTTDMAAIIAFQTASLLNSFAISMKGLSRP